MTKHLLQNSFVTILFVAVIGLSNCREIDVVIPPQKEGIVALVYTDLTKSINEETANRQKANIVELFQNLPEVSKFFLFSVDRGTNKPSIYQFAPTFPKIKVAEDERKVNEKIAETKEAKESTELKFLKSSLDSYHDSITRERGPVSCISNKLNSLVDTIESKTSSFPGYEIRLYFYSDMIEQCQNSFDGEPITFERHPDSSEEAKHLQEIQNRIEKNFVPAKPNKNLKSMGVKIYVILTSQDDKQRLTILKTIWNSFFKKLGLAEDDIKWTIGNENYFWTL